MIPVIEWSEPTETDHEFGRWAPNTKSERLGLVNERSAIGSHVDEINGIEVPRSAVHGLHIVRNIRASL